LNGGTRQEEKEVRFFGDGYTRGPRMNGQRNGLVYLSEEKRSEEFGSDRLSRMCNTHVQYACWKIYDKRGVTMMRLGGLVGSMPPSAATRLTPMEPRERRAVAAESSFSKNAKAASSSEWGFLLSPQRLIMSKYCLAQCGTAHDCQAKGRRFGISFPPILQSVPYYLTVLGFKGTGRKFGGVKWGENPMKVTQIKVAFSLSRSVSSILMGGFRVLGKQHKV
jgi:hypothetical protein